MRTRVTVLGPRTEIASDTFHTTLRAVASYDIRAARRRPRRCLFPQLCRAVSRRVGGHSGFVQHGRPTWLPLEDSSRRGRESGASDGSHERGGPHQLRQACRDRCRNTDGARSRWRSPLKAVAQVLPAGTTRSCPVWPGRPYCEAFHSQMTGRAAQGGGAGPPLPL